jgi:type II secretory pathway component PulF
MVAPVNKRFAHLLGQALITGEELPDKTFSESLPPFYLTILNCGIITGRLPQALAAAAHYVRQVLPVKYTLRRCLKYSFVAYTVCLIITWVFRQRPSFVLLLILAAFDWLPRWFDTLAYGRDMILAKLPFVGTWSQQTALLEFFSCLDLCYDSTLSVPDMFQSSCCSVGNRYLRNDLLKAKAAVEQGDSFADALGQVDFIPSGIIADVRVNELCGKLEHSFGGFARELRKLVEAKLELVKGQATFWIIGYGVIMPVAIVLPLFLNVEWLGLYLSALMVYLGWECMYMAYKNYTKKACEVNCWWEGLCD